MPKTLVIIPAFNEEKNILQIITSIRSLYPEFDIAVINDGSTDRTAEEALRGEALLLNHPFNIGYGATVQTGYKFAFHNGYDYLIQIDGDGQHDPACIRDLYTELVRGRADLVLGSRFNQGLQYQPDAVRRTGMALFNWIVNCITRLHLTDVTSGFQGMNRNVLREFIKDSFPINYPDADVIIKAYKKGLRITEVPVVMYENKEGKSMHATFYRAFVYVLQMLIAIFIAFIQKEDSET